MLNVTADDEATVTEKARLYMLVSFVSRIELPESALINKYHVPVMAGTVKVKDSDSIEIIPPRSEVPVPSN